MLNQAANLRWVTQQQNVRRTKAQADDIRIRVAAGEPKRALAREYGIAPKTIRDLMQGVTWKDVPAPHRSANKL